MIYCALRREWVAKTPEEIIRQRLIGQMVNELGYPTCQLVAEKGLNQMPHLGYFLNKKIPRRRADLLCFVPNIHPEYPLYPLLLVECKAVKLTQKVIHQVVGYNHYVKAFFVAVVNGEEIKLGWHDPSLQEYRFISGLPQYRELIGMLKF